MIDFKTLQIPDLKNLTLEEIKRFVEEVNKLYQGIDIKQHTKISQIPFDYNKCYDQTFSELQSTIERNIELPMESRIILTDDLANIISFLKSVKELKETDFAASKDDIYFEFKVSFKHWIEELMSTLGL